MPPNGCAASDSDKISRMRNLRRSCFLFLALSFVVLCGQVSSSDGDSRAVRDVIARYMRARNDKDADAVRKLFTADADQLVSNGEWRKGIDNLVRGAAASSQKEMGKSSIAIESLRFVDRDVAVVDGRYQTTSLSGTVRNMWTTLIVKRGEGEWRIAAIRNMLPSAPAAAH
jgi:uncharacterized protein (TIGR02246 family)